MNYQSIKQIYINIIKSCCKVKILGDNEYVVKRSDGDKAWFLNGKLHREYSPAIECADGNKYWYLNGQLHRANGPAIEFSNGGKEWWVNHRDNKPAMSMLMVTGRMIKV